MSVICLGVLQDESCMPVPFFVKTLVEAHNISSPLGMPSYHFGVDVGTGLSYDPPVGVEGVSLQRMNAVALNDRMLKLDHMAGVENSPQTLPTFRLFDIHS